MWFIAVVIQYLASFPDGGIDAMLDIDEDSCSPNNGLIGQLIANDT
jgi:hypothetical protein